MFLLLGSPGAGHCGEDPGRGIFVSVIQDPPVLSSREAISGLVEFARAARIDTLFVQVHYQNRSWFASKTADASQYEACLKCVGEDPLNLLIRQAHAAGIKVHAWLNLLSLGSNADAPLLARYGTDILTRNTIRKSSLEDYKIDDQYFLEPGDERVRQAVSDIVGEVVTASPELDGIQFDYIRYPDKDPAYGHTEANVRRFREATGWDNSNDPRECDEPWRKWKRDQVTELLTIAVAKARAVHPGITVSATGCMPYPRAYHEAFQDWPSWLESGIVDFVTLMSYSPYPDEFQRWILRAKEKTADFGKVRIGIGAYKLVGSGGIFRNELAVAEGSGAGGFIIFHYGSLLEDPELGGIVINDGRR